jgi:prevent-host-death family protein
MSDTHSDRARKKDLAVIGSRTLQREAKDVLDRIEKTGEPVVVLRHGTPVAALVPVDEERAKEIALATAVRLRRQTSESDDEDREPKPFAVAQGEDEAEAEVAVEVQPVEGSVVEVKGIHTAVDAAVEKIMARGDAGGTIVGRQSHFGAPMRIDMQQRSTSSTAAGLAEQIRRQAEALAAMLAKLEAEGSGKPTSPHGG